MTSGWAHLCNAPDSSSLQVGEARAEPGVGGGLFPGGRLCSSPEPASEMGAQPTTDGRAWGGDPT